LDLGLIFGTKFGYGTKVLDFQRTRIPVFFSKWNLIWDFGKKGLEPGVNRRLTES
jgi:hypothetical protein